MSSSEIRESRAVPANDDQYWLELDSNSKQKDLAALDELFSLTTQYSSNSGYAELMRFVGSFRFYSPFNALLIHIQMSGARFVAPAHRWWNKYQHRIKPGARPITILQPKGPVMFVFDVSDTEPGPNAPPLPHEVVAPFEVRRGKIRNELSWTVENAKRDGIRVSEQSAGSQRAGCISASDSGGELEVVTQLRPEQKSIRVPLRYELLLNGRHAPEVQYATLAHELGHLYCGHIGTPNRKWWPDRHSCDVVVREFEAESVCYLVCQRIGIDNPSEQYLAGYAEKNAGVPKISLEAVMTAAGLIERMGRGRLKPRPKEDARAATSGNRH